MSVLQESRAVARAKPIVVVTFGARRPPGARPIDSVTASIIVRARHHWHQRTQASVTRAIEYFTRAAERDARAVDAWCGLADAWVVMGGRGYAPIADAINRASASAERALALDDTLSSVYTSVGGVNILRRRWHDAETSLNRAIELDPQNADARHWLALTLLTGYGNCDGAVREQTVAARLNPLAAIQVGTLGWQRYLRGEYDLSRSEMEPTVDLNAELEEGHAGLARAAARLGDESTVMATIAAGLTRRTDLRGDLLAEQASAHAVLGDSRRGRARGERARRVADQPRAGVGDARRGGSRVSGARARVVSGLLGPAGRLVGSAIRRDPR
jgi:tetratricopeptide (TPR) repeat protein